MILYLRQVQIFVIIINYSFLFCMSFLPQVFEKKNIRKLQDESLLAARGHIAAISSVRRHYNNTHMAKY